LFALHRRVSGGARLLRWLAKGGTDPQCKGRDALEATARDIRAECGVRVVAVAADVTSDLGRASVLAARPDPDILVNNAGGPPPGDFRDVGGEAWIHAIDANMLTPILLVRR